MIKWFVEEQRRLKDVVYFDLLKLADCQQTVKLIYHILQTMIHL